MKQLNDACADELKKALSNDEVSIHWAWKLRDESSENQLDALGRLRFEKRLRTESGSVLLAGVKNRRYRKMQTGL